MTSSATRESTLTRDELCDRVWSTPMRKLAPHFGLSDVGLKKLCNRHHIPTPPVGYWAKKEFGKAPRPTPLPAESDPSLQVVRLAYDPEPPPRAPSPPPSYPVVTPELIALVERERDPMFHIAVADNLRNPHPMVQRTREALAERSSPDRYNLHRPSWRVDAVDLAVAEPSIPRALRLMNALFLALEKRGWPVDVWPRNMTEVHEGQCPHCTILGEEFEFGLREKVRMIPVPPEERRGIFDRQVRYEPRGAFELTVTGGYRHTVGIWRDAKRSRVEDQLNEVVVGLIVAVETKRQRREAERCEQLTRAAAEQARRERERLAELERARVSGFESLAERWEKAGRLRAFLDAVREEAVRRQVAIEAERGFARWLEWAEQHVQTVDPLATGGPLPTY